MAKGKHKTLSERRKEVSEELSNLSVLKRQLLDMTKENALLKEQISSDQQSHKQEVRRLNDRITEGASTELEDMREINGILISKLNETKEDYESVHDKWTKAFINLREYLREKEGLTEVESLERVVGLIGDPDDKNRVLDVGDYAKHIKKDGLSSEEVVKRILQLQKARGIR
jgi:hypothetical protein